MAERGTKRVGRWKNGRFGGKMGNVDVKWNGEKYNRCWERQTD